MFTVEIDKLVPKFLMDDINGYALAKAMETGLQILNDTISEGVSIMSDIDEMPEWRLDEMAWEFNCLYDYKGAIESKREWIRTAQSLYRLLGTPKSILNYIEGIFDEVTIEENWQYNGSPYHFRIMFNGEWTPASYTLVNDAVTRAKNVRSILDGVSLISGAKAGMSMDGLMLTQYNLPIPSADHLCGTWPPA